MNKTILIPIVSVLAAGLISGCGPSSSPGGGDAGGGAGGGANPAGSPTGQAEPRKPAGDVTSMRSEQPADALVESDYLKLVAASDGKPVDATGRWVLGPEMSHLNTSREQ